MSCTYNNSKSKVRAQNRNVRTVCTQEVLNGMCAQIPKVRKCSVNRNVRTVRGEGS